LLYTIIRMLHYIETLEFFEIEMQKYAVKFINTVSIVWLIAYKSKAIRYNLWSSVVNAV
jgi:hypothetical protein